MRVTHSSVVKIAVAYITIPSFTYFLSLLPFPSIFSPALSERHPIVFGSVLLMVSLIPPSLVAYVLLFALERESREDYERRAWNSERIRGLRAGDDYDGDGDVDCAERVQESAEWLNALVRGIWPIMNAEL